jgi:hypothetical protein
VLDDPAGGVLDHHGHQATRPYAQCGVCPAAWVVEEGEKKARGRGAAAAALGWEAQ